MIETIVLEYLNQALDVPAYMERPERPTKQYVLLERTSGSQRNKICSATLAVKSIAPTLYQAALLNEAVKAAMEQTITMPAISSAKLDTDYNFTDTTTREYRYQAVYDLTYYREEE